MRIWVEYIDVICDPQQPNKVSGEKEGLSLSPSLGPLERLHTSKKGMGKPRVGGEPCPLGLCPCVGHSLKFSKLQCPDLEISFTQLLDVVHRMASRKKCEMAF